MYNFHTHSRLYPESVNNSITKKKGGKKREIMIENFNKRLSRFILDVSLFIKKNR